MIFLHWQRKQCHLYGCVTQHFVIERPSLSGGGGWAPQNCFDRCELANNVPLMLFWLSREAIASPSSTDDACLCTCAKERRECHLPLTEHGSSEEKMTRLRSCHSISCTAQASASFPCKVNNKRYFKQLYGKWENLYRGCHYCDIWDDVYVEVDHNTNTSVEISAAVCLPVHFGICPL